MRTCDYCYGNLLSIKQNVKYCSKSHRTKANNLRYLTKEKSYLEKKYFDQEKLRKESADLSSQEIIQKNSIVN